jgi:light-regulated signal transduction histidine kinase (bacteriophytochrome)
VSLAAVVDDVKAELSTELASRVVTWKIGQLPEVQADAAMLRIVLRNLMDNAAKYTGPVASPTVEIDASIEPTHVHVWVKDNGVGFEPQYTQKLFGIFQRLHTTEQFEGVGIGLANVRRIVTRHGGRVWAEGAVGAGATFHFTLPRTGASAAEEQKP